MPLAQRRCKGAMADYLFVPQSVLDKWSEQGRVQVDGQVLTLLGDNKSFQLTSAVRFLKMEAGEDTAGLLKKVKTTDALKQLPGPRFRFGLIVPGNQRRNQHIFENGALRQQIMILENKANVPVAKVRKLTLRQRERILAFNLHLAGGRLEKAHHK